MNRPIAWCVAALVLCVAGALGAEPTGRRAKLAPVRGILYNEDDSHRFVLDPAGKIEPDRLDKLVDELADSQVTAMLVCCCAKKTNFPSKSWEPHCEGFDPAKDNNQPYFGDLPPESRPGARQWPENLRRMLDAGVDPTGRMLDRCRQRGIGPWVSMRMNDVHDANYLRSPLHSRFWMEHHEYWRYPDRFNGWNDRCFNYGLKPVRDHAMALVRELCDRYDMEGLELDWNRFPLHFREGEEIEQGKVLTGWMGEVRRVVLAAEKKCKHPIRLVARVPARPEVAAGTGLDAVAWARQGLIDHLVVAPFWATTDYDIPVEQWRKLLEGTGVGVTAGLEIRIQPYPGAPTIPNTPARRRGAAMAALGRGSQGIYVFNYFDVGRRMPQLLREMGSIETLRGKDRSYLLTYVDITVPGRPIPAALPRKVPPGQSAEFRLFIGPKPIAGARGEVALGLDAGGQQGKPEAAVTVNGRPASAGADAFRFPGEAFQEGYNTVRVTNRAAAPVTIKSVELSVLFGKE